MTERGWPIADGASGVGMDIFVAVLVCVVLGGVGLFVFGVWLVGLGFFSLFCSVFAAE